MPVLYGDLEIDFSPENGAKLFKRFESISITPDETDDYTMTFGRDSGLRHSAAIVRDR